MRAVARCWSVVALAALTLGAASASPAKTKIDFAGQAYNVLPPGEMGRLPTDRNSTSQIPLYDGLTPLRGHVTTRDLGTYFKSEHFGVQGPMVRRESTGRAGLRVLRDRFDVPHVYGQTRDEVMFGAGWVAIEDRMLLMEEARGPARVAARAGASTPASPARGRRSR